MPDLQVVVPPFRTDAPPWYNNGVWGQLGCAVPQTGKILHTQNAKIWGLVQDVGAHLFSTLWKYDDRLLTAFPTRNCMYEIYRLIIVGRKVINDMTIPNGESPPVVIHGTPAYQMFVLYPVPLYGQLGCVQPFLRYATERALLMLTEIMQHQDNARDNWVTPVFAQAVMPYLQDILITMATGYFGFSRADASKPDFVIPDTNWGSDPATGYDPSKWSISQEATSTRPPVGWKPTEEDLDPIRGLPASRVIPFCQPWPDTTLEYSPGGVWAGQPGAPPVTQPTTQAGTPAQSLSGSFPTPAGPPSGAPAAQTVAASSFVPPK